MSAALRAPRQDSALDRGRALARALALDHLLAPAAAVAPGKAPTVALAPGPWFCTLERELNRARAHGRFPVDFRGRGLFLALFLSS